MKNIANLLTSSIVAIWVGAIAILSVQNATQVSLKFLGFESIKLPVGVVLAFSASLGVVGGAIAFPLFIPSENLADDDFEDDVPENRQSSGGSDWLETGSQDW